MSQPPTPTAGQPLFEVVLHQPEIPNNTGNIGRTCVATRCALHLIHPLGFEVSDKACRRAGLDYWPRLNVREHADWDEYRTRTGISRSRLWLFSTRSERCIFDVELNAGDHLIFGSESRGLPETLLEMHPDRVVAFPMASGERSMNVASIVAAAVFEGVRQLQDRNVLGRSRYL